MWEIIGLVSYLLINFYFTRVQANKAAILAFTMNRQGDMLLSIGFMAIFALFGSLNYSSVFALAPYMNETALTIIALLLFGGACAKSSQLPLHSWLPGSMEAEQTTTINLNYLITQIKIFNITYILSRGSLRQEEVYLFYIFTILSLASTPPLLREWVGEIRSSRLCKGRSHRYANA